METRIAQPNSRQVGGQHYIAEYQHWDLVCDANMGYFEGQISKYLSRWRKKNGAEDVAKALHYMDKLITLHVENRIHMRTVPDTRPALEKFFASGGRELPGEERAIFIGLAQYRTLEELHSIRPLVLALLSRTSQGTGVEYCPHGYANKGNCNLCRAGVR